MAAELDLDLDQWMPAYRVRHRETMIGEISGILERVRRSVEDAGYERSPQQVRVAVERCFPDFVASIRVDPQADALLARLRGRGLPLALVTNASDHSEEIFDRLGLRKYFDVTVFSYQVKRLKPDPEIYQAAVDGLALAPEHCAYVGDGGDHELYGARRVGLTTILVDRRLKHSAAARADADVVVDDLVAVGDALAAREAKG
jgi:putative hydrolase of the HAD superfamily